jgi:hypothetical protein
MIALARIRASYVVFLVERGTVRGAYSSRSTVIGSTEAARKTGSATARKVVAANANGAQDERARIERCTQQGILQQPSDREGQPHANG